MIRDSPQKSKVISLRSLNERGQLLQPLVSKVNEPSSIKAEPSQPKKDIYLIANQSTSLESLCMTKSPCLTPETDCSKFYSESEMMIPTVNTIPVDEKAPCPQNQQKKIELFREGSFGNHEEPKLTDSPREGKLRSTSSKSLDDDHLGDLLSSSDHSIKKEKSDQNQEQTQKAAKAKVYHRLSCTSENTPEFGPREDSPRKTSPDFKSATIGKPFSVGPFGQFCSRAQSREFQQIQTQHTFANLKLTRIQVGLSSDEVESSSGFLESRLTLSPNQSPNCMHSPADSALWKKETPSKERVVHSFIHEPVQTGQQGAMQEESTHINKTLGFKTQQILILISIALLLIEVASWVRSQY